MTHRCAVALFTAAATLCAAVSAMAQALSPIEVRVPLAPAPVAASDGRHLLFEMLVTSYARRELDLDFIEISDAADGRVIARFADERLKEALARTGSIPSPDDPRKLAGGSTAIVFLDAVVAPGAPVPKRLGYKIRLLAQPFEGKPPPVADAMVSNSIAVDLRPPRVIGAPFRDGLWVAGGAPSVGSYHRRGLYAVDGAPVSPERYAIDWNRIGPNGRLGIDGAKGNADYFSYGQEVLAVADGRVVDVLDGIAENDPSSDKLAVPITVDNAAGNHVVLAIGDGQYAIYAHLQPGRLRVKQGESVRKGQVLGLLGNSGNSLGPHLHFQLSDGPTWAAQGHPYVFEAYRLEGAVASLQEATDKAWISPAQAQARRHELPLENQVVRFPGA